MKVVSGKINDLNSSVSRLVIDGRLGVASFFFKM